MASGSCGGLGARMSVDGSPNNLRHRAVELLEHWYFQREASAVRPQHSLVTVQEMHLEDAGDHAVHAIGTRRSSGSKPPIRDMDPLARRVDSIMRLIRETNPSWLIALESYVEHGTIRKAAEAKRVKTSLLWRNFDQGIAALQVELVRLGL